MYVQGEAPQAASEDSSHGLWLDGADLTSSDFSGAILWANSDLDADLHVEGSSLASSQISRLYASLVYRISYHTQDSASDRDTAVSSSCPHLVDMRHGMAIWHDKN